MLKKKIKLKLIQKVQYISPKLATKMLYTLMTGKKLNLVNPSTFDEKI